MSREVMLQAFDAMSYGNTDEREAARIALREALAQPEQEPVLQDIEQYRMQMAGISTAALGYWKDGDGIHPDYDTVELRDMAKLYAKYDALYKARWAAQPEQEPVATLFGSLPVYDTSPPQRQPLTDEEIEALIPQPVLRDERGRGFGGEGSWDRVQVRKFARAIEAAHNIGDKT